MSLRFTDIHRTGKITVEIESKSIVSTRLKATKTVCDCNRRHIEWKVSAQLCCHLHNCQLFFDATQNPTHQSPSRNEIMPKVRRTTDRTERKRDRNRERSKTNTTEKCSNTNCRHNAMRCCRTTISAFGIFVISHFCLASLSWKYSTFFIQSLDMNHMRCASAQNQHSHNFSIVIRSLFIAWPRLIIEKFRLAATESTANRYAIIQQFVRSTSRNFFSVCFILLLPPS